MGEPQNEQAAPAPVDAEKVKRMGEILSFPNQTRRPKGVTFKVHDYAAARRACKDGQKPLLGFQGNGVKHELLPTGQHIRLHRKDRTITARQRRKMDKEFRRNERLYRENMVTPTPPTKEQMDAGLGMEIAEFSQLGVEAIVAMVKSDQLPFNVAFRLEQLGKNRQEVLQALAEVAPAGAIETVEVEGAAPAQNPAKGQETASPDESACMK